MANVMSLATIRNKTSRNGFDLSFKKNFSAKVGELLPVMCKEVYPGDVFDIDIKALVRTKPLNTAAFGRIKEYYDFYFVPYELLWNKTFTVLSQMLDNSQHSTSWNPLLRSNLEGKVPFVSMGNIGAYIRYLTGGAGTTPSGAKNYFGFNRGKATCKLLEYLGYGNYYPLIGSSASYQPLKNLNLNIFGLLAYQKIYYDHFRNQQWESSNPSAFNVDWITGSGDLDMSQIINESVFYNNYNMFDLRYCNWEKDMFHGVVPNAQYGTESVYPLSAKSFTYVTNIDGDQLRVPSLLTANQTVLSDLSILKLRQYEFLQKWKEVVLSANKDYKDQIKKHWNVDVSDYSSEISQWLGGTTNVIGINEVVNTNITADNPADIAGKGYGVSDGRIRFDSNGKYGMLMCIYHAVPLIDYTTDSINPAFAKVEASDFAIPEFDQVGMQGVPLVLLNNPFPGSGDVVWNSNRADDILGYAPRYIDLKTSIDESVGSFKRSDSSWIIGFGNADLHAQYSSSIGAPLDIPTDLNNPIDYTFFKVSPSSVNSIFAVAADDELDTDQLLCSSFTGMNVVRNLDTNGLPY